MENLGDRLRARAQELKLSDSEVARRLGMSQSRYTNYVNDKREPDFATFIRICRTLAISPDQALGFADPEPSTDIVRLQRRIAAASAAMDLDTLNTAAVVMDALCAAMQPRDDT